MPRQSGRGATVEQPALNRTNRSGIISGGVIGGQGQGGPWRLDARFNRADLIDRVEKIARYRNRISVYGMDAALLLRTVIPKIPGKMLVYLDPPYYVKGAEGLYEHHYGPADHAEIAGLVRGLNRPWIVSYDAAPAVEELYRGLRFKKYRLNYSAQSRYAGSEIIIFGPGLKAPAVDNPARMPASECPSAI